MQPVTAIGPVKDNNKKKIKKNTEGLRPFFLLILFHIKTS